MIINSYVFKGNDLITKVKQYLMRGDDHELWAGNDMERVADTWLKILPWHLHVQLEGNEKPQSHKHLKKVSSEYKSKSIYTFSLTFDIHILNKH